MKEVDGIHGCVYGVRLGPARCHPSIVTSPFESNESLRPGKQIIRKWSLKKGLEQSRQDSRLSTTVWTGQHDDAGDLLTRDFGRLRL